MEEDELVGLACVRALDGFGRIEGLGFRVGFMGLIRVSGCWGRGCREI